MNKYIFTLFAFSFIIISVSCFRQTPNQIYQNLSGNWEFKSVDDSIWRDAVVPGTVHTDLLANDIIKDPFYRLNEHDLQWIDKTDWEYLRSFNVDEHMLKKETIELVFDGIDTWADIYLNDSLIGNVNNMFIKWRFNCTELIHAGKNTLLIRLNSPILEGLKKRDSLGFILPGAENDQSELGGLGNKKVCVFSRKAQYHFGWDWGPRLVTSGIWKDVYLDAYDEVKINDLQVYQNNITSEVANLNIVASINTTNAGSYTLVTSLDNQVADAIEITLEKGENEIDYMMDILYPELWWPNGLGKQHLYDIRIQVKNNFTILDTKNQTIGLRKIELVREPDSVGASFYFKVNDQPVFMKGANYIPQDVFLNRPAPENYAYLIKSAKDANFNMLRVWGGGIYEKDIFYELCDQAGILVWQDFMFACAMYPGDNNFLDNVKREAIENVKRLRNHPSIALWCGDNEILSAWNRWGWKENVIANQGEQIGDTIWKAYDTLFHSILPEVVNKYDRGRYYWPSSPSSGFGELENGKSGDNHYWGVWWAKEPFSSYEINVPRFMSEFGFQSFPVFNSVKKYSDSSDWNIYSDVMKSHQRSSIGNATIEEYMFRDYNEPEDFEMFLYVGQLLQARGIEIGIEAHRRAMPYCMGSLYWQLNDCWPVASWSSIDYYGIWKALHYAVKEAFKETIISAVQKDGLTEFYIVNDKHGDLNGNLQVSLVDFYGKTIYSDTISVNVISNSSNVYHTVNFKGLLEKYGYENLLVTSRLYGSNNKLIDEDIMYFVPLKNLNLRDPIIQNNIIETDSNYIITLRSDKLAKNVFLSINDNCFFLENYFDLLPGISKEVTFTTKKKHDLKWMKNNIKIISLYDSYSH